MIERSSWQELRDSGLLWWINRSLHLFGWAIVVEVDADGHVLESYPARCKFRGFDEASETDGFGKLTRYLSESVPSLLQDIDDNKPELNVVAGTPPTVGNQGKDNDAPTD